MKNPRQKKSRMYYYFWSAMTITVFLGQLYVGTGYRLLHGSMQELLDKVDGVLLHKSDNPSYGLMKND
tara:strand:+ start:99 stop:302 length:204 start_codon:yes stop_codon:yes gene_type:complete